MKKQISSETKSSLTNHMKRDTIEQGDKMDFYGKTKKLSDKDFKQIVGVKRETFDAMAAILKEAYARKPYA